MTRFVSGVTGLIGGLALVMAGATVDLHAQRGAGGGHGRPATTGNAGQHGKDGHATHETGTTGRATVGAQLTRNTNLTSRLQTLFPAGTDLQKESAGFRNLGQFVAAAHVSHNLGIPWTDLKAKMAGDHPVSLGKAIQDLKPQADAQTEASKAQKEANTDIKDSTKKTTTTAS
ncbi:MAG TPA: hypothetical protein VGJ78_17050 [Vicinamibacterales bacterium]|jgi:hypothetical protein